MAVWPYFGKKLIARKNAGLLRQLPDAGVGNGIDFSSNDYLGFAQMSFKSEVHDCGASGSRLLTGNSKQAVELECFIADAHQAESALLFSSGYAANVGLFGALGDRHVTFITDELIHASVIDGIRLSNAKKYKFKHNDLNHLEDILRRTPGPAIVAVESVYSMEGDSPDLPALLNLAAQYDAGVVVDEAHALGWAGDQGMGYTQGLMTHPALLAVVVTFGKGLGYHGAAVLGRNGLHSYLVNFARSFIYSTGISSGMMEQIKLRYRHLLDSQVERDQLKSVMRSFLKDAAEHCESFSQNTSPIQFYMAGGIEQVNALQRKGQQGGLAIRSIKYPTVPAGSERLRINLHAFNSRDELLLLKDVLS